MYDKGLDGGGGGEHQVTGGGGGEHPVTGGGGGEHQVTGGGEHTATGAFQHDEDLDDVDECIVDGSEHISNTLATH